MHTFIKRGLLTIAGNLCHFEKDGVTELSKLDKGLHPGADMHFVLFSNLQAIDCLLSMRLLFQLKNGIFQSNMNK